MVLLAGSIAINAGSNGLVPGGVTTDQREAGYSRIISGTVDMGAYETQNPTAVTLAEFGAAQVSGWLNGLVIAAVLAAATVIAGLRRMQRSKLWRQPDRGGERRTPKTETGVFKNGLRTCGRFSTHS
jgi:hypothetical protein